MANASEHLVARGTAQRFTPSKERRDRPRRTGQWNEFSQNHQRHDRNRLVLDYYWLVPETADRISRGLPGYVDQGDLVSYGIFGLIDAIERFDPDRNTMFEAYAITRIRGSIIDHLRSLDWVPRSVRSKARSLEAVNAKLQAELQRKPTDAEIADELGMAMDSLRQMLFEISAVRLIALDERVPGSDPGDPTTVGGAVPDREGGPDVPHEKWETEQELAAAINRLGDREKLVVTLYHYEGLTMAQIGAILGVTESRVSQINSKSLLRLRSELELELEEAA